MRKDYSKRCKRCGKTPLRLKAVVRQLHYDRLKDKCMTCGELQ